MKPNCDAVLMIGFGGPDRREQIRPFLDRVLKGHPVPPARYEEVVHHYEAIGGRSPYNELILKQAAALRALLWRRGPRLPVQVGMRNSPPYLADALLALARAKAQRVLGFILAPHRSEASWGRYQRDVDEAQQEIGAQTPAVEYVEPWHNHPLFIDAVAAQTSGAMARLSAAQRSSAQIVFTAHSIPVAMAAACNYVDELTESARLVAKALGHTAWSIAFQSRSGDPREPWLRPDIGEALSKLGGRPAVVVPIGFVCDHIEVLYDLDVQAAEIARQNGIHMIRASAVNDHPRFIEMMAAVIHRHLES